MAIQLTAFENNIVNDLICALRFTFEMSKKTKEKICAQGELPIVLINTMELKTFIKGYHVYKNTQISKEGEQLEGFMEPEKSKDKLQYVL